VQAATTVPAQIVEGEHNLKPLNSRTVYDQLLADAVRVSLINYTVTSVRGAGI
jgi:hypothetical protein